ncbi:white colony protein WHS11 [Lodderomyces elongisporus NRRL YB-4239]|uniref:White colony protein WHS11 n=1 Tax=Lodderomyces elongisporus (strain ATCC 11503 / CBS 2605 / JCM 1781 / NBRC 1676 / NRRL YB-4239) TaxID=379508 RepID=A5DTE5_LODEL|nr:white colony protein WHS11 [Lodderomyces elongisporus NRRL YB-4239]
MSDLGRQNIGDKVESAVKPDSQKSTGESLKDTVAGKVDDFAGKGQSDKDKSWTQKASDAVFGESK